MSVENYDKIDIVSIDLKGRTVLTITDHLEWDSENEHLPILQRKINTYLGAIETGELFEHYPEYQGRQVIISIVAKHKPHEDGNKFLQMVKDKLESSGYEFQFCVTLE